MRKPVSRLLAVIFSIAHVAVAALAQEPAPERLPRWRGFNLVEKQRADHVERFCEEDFRLIAKWGFNFVRLPMDYRIWIRNGDWEQFDETAFRDIDEAVAWGGRYGIHVCLNFHRAPGYTVSKSKPPEAHDLWSDVEAQRVCAKHWAVFARRYKGVPNTQLSFNLFNEPHGVTASNYVAVVQKIVLAIRTEDPKRLVICDGLEWGNKPVPELKALGVAQATRGYQPFQISHYRAPWISYGKEEHPLPAWPRPIEPSGILPSISKNTNGVSLVVNGSFGVDMQLRVRLHTVSASARLVVVADGRTLWEKLFQCGPGTGEWKQVTFRPEWNIYQNLYDRDYTAVIPSGAQQVRISVTEGDWVRLSEIGLKPLANTGVESVLELMPKWGKMTESVRYVPGAADGPWVTSERQDRTWLQQQCILPWTSSEMHGVGVMVGEWGAYNKTPHATVLRWAEDCLANWKAVGWGWALWNFCGSFGVLDSDRLDVKYEQFEGHKLDRKLLELLQRY